MSGRDTATVSAAFALAIASANLSSQTAAAQESAPGFALNRFEPAERGGHWFTADSLDLRGNQRWSVGGVVDWAHRPLVAYDANGNVHAPVIANQAYVHLGGAFILAERVRFGGDIPFLFHQDGQMAVIAGRPYEPAHAGALGDARLASDVRLLGGYGKPVTVALGLGVHLPSGDRASYAGDGKARFVPRVQAAGQFSEFVYAVRLGSQIRLQTEEFAEEPFGSELACAVAAGARLVDDRLVVGPELFLSTVLLAGGAFARKTTPAELVLGAHYEFAHQWRLGLGVGAGLSRGFGAPAARGLLSLEWVQPLAVSRGPVAEPTPEPSGNDHGAIDPCIDRSGSPGDNPIRGGCPAPTDRDSDGIENEVDACPDLPGVADTAQPAQHGCPIPDTDEDGILDPVDACPTDPGVANVTNHEAHGCPLRDRDGDGILDPVDACPDDPGEPQLEMPDQHGCPTGILDQHERSEQSPGLEDQK